AWHFPNRYVSWGQGFSGIEDRKSLFWQGNAYNTRFAGAAAVVEYVRDHYEHLDGITRTFRDTFFDSTLPYELLDTVSSQMSILRTPTCLWMEDGRFHAFEGCGGASTGGWLATGGCCPMDCTHVKPPLIDNRNFFWQHPDFVAFAPVPSYLINLGGRQ